jgi:hypothetical protein
MYGKVFDSIYNGTLYGHWEALVTMQQLIVLADADGVVDMTPMAISARTSIPRDIIDKGLEILGAPDKYTRTEGSDGRRIELIDEHRPWGWVLVNYEKYKTMVDADTVRAQTRERVRRFRDKKKNSAESSDVTDVTHVTLGNASLRHIDIDIDIDIDKPKTIGHSVTEGFDRWWKIYPKKRDKKKALAAWKRIKPDADTLITDTENRITADSLWLDGYIPNPSTYLNGERWHDEIETRRASSRKLTYAEQLAADMKTQGMLK